MQNTAVNQPTPTPTAQPTQAQTQGTKIDESANWKTYSNSQYGFEIQLPIDWQVKVATNSNANNGSIAFNSKENIKKAEEFKGKDMGGNPSNISIVYVDDMVKEATKEGKKLNIIPQLSYSTLQEYVKLNSDFNGTYSSFAGHDAFQGKQGGMFDTDVIYVAKNNHVYMIESATSNGYGMDLQLNQKILSTFKFTK